MTHTGVGEGELRELKGLGEGADGVGGQPVADEELVLLCEQKDHQRFRAREKMEGFFTSFHSGVFLCAFFPRSCKIRSRDSHKQTEREKKPTLRKRIEHKKGAKHMENINH